MAAQRPAAYADSSHYLCLIPYAHLAQFNPGLKHAGQVLYQFAEVNASVRGKVKQDFIIVKCIFSINQLHLQVMLLNFVLADLKCLFFLILILCLHRLILSSGHTDDRL